MVERLDSSKIDLLKTVEVLKNSGVSTDIDGVEVASAFLSIQEFNRLHGIKINNPKTIDDINDYAIMVSWFDEDPNVEDSWLAAKSIWNSRHVLEGAGHVQGYLTVLKYLDERDVVPYRITSRPGSTRKWTEN